MNDQIVKYAADFLADLEPEEIAYLVDRESLDHFTRTMLDTMVSRSIRNEFGLWISNPMTQEWRNNEFSRTIIDGVDHSPDHPDNISNKIMIEVYKIVDRM